MLNNFRFTIIIGFSLLIFLLLTIAGHNIYQIRTIYDSLHSVISSQNKKLNIVTDLQVAGYNRSDSLYQMMLSDDPFIRDEIYLAYNRHGFNVGKARNQLKKQSLSSSEQSVFNRQSQLIEEVVIAQEQIVNLLTEENPIAAQKMMREKVIPLQAAINLTFQEIRNKQTEASEKALNNAKNTYIDTIKFSLSLGLVVLFVATYVAFSVYRRLALQAGQINQNISELKTAYESMEILANYDQLTQIPNRAMFERTFYETIELSKQQKHRFALLYFDLDKFKQVNDQFGHHAGDKLLHLAAKRIRNCLRKDDLLARLGGDEFVAIVKAPHSQSISQDIESIAHKIIKVLSEAFRLDEGNAKIGTSIGIALFPHHGQNGEVLLKAADKAMYEAKNDGRNRYKIANGNQ